MADDFNFDFSGNTPPPDGVQPPVSPPVPETPQPQAPVAPQIPTYPGNQAPQYQQGNGNPPPAVPPQQPIPPAAPYTTPAQPPYPQQGYPQAPYTPVPPANMPYNPQPAYIPAPVPFIPQEGRGMAIGSLVLGILSIVCCAAWYVSAVLALVGLVLGIIAKSKGNGGMATAGIVLSAIGLVFMIVIVVMLNVYQENILDWMTEFYNGLEEESYYTAIRGFFHR